MWVITFSRQIFFSELNCGQLQKFSFEFRKNQMQTSKSLPVSSKCFQRVLTQDCGNISKSVFKSTYIRSTCMFLIWTSFYNKILTWCKIGFQLKQIWLNFLISKFSPFCFRDIAQWFVAYMCGRFSFGPWHSYGSLYTFSRNHSMLSLESFLITTECGYKSLHLSVPVG